ncbi:hypothetical protein A5784_36225 [Mycobacterium sp. 852013-50091_SCH5140682]|uniref:hypothetical protein n=1 Tax=Mycobacterium sp. 852013-50091_SCH5140682 TaxID=1834109 RepID=UPI0007EBE399|nr:hypothetical protein [Mycobacterium sp. 852013-50091_SCH5140682]OBC10946.1 hypothetical protein A5784_36225 [Mycobacterium sp. 852013-50091_SCH5140682]
MMWDDEFDVVCCGSGLGVLACAIAAADADLDVLLAQPGVENRHEADAPLLGPGIEDPQTREYFDALSADVGSVAAASNDVELTVRSVRAPAPARPGSPIAPFYGARLRDWAVECLLSPYGVLYTRLTDRETQSMQTQSGEDIEVKVIGSVTSGDGAVSALDEWLIGQTRDRDISTYENSTLERIVFEEDEIVGVVLNTDEGPRAIRTRHGIAVAGRQNGPARGALPVDEPNRTLQVGLVGQSASRFARVELLVTDPTAGSSSSEYCTSDLGRGGGRSHVRHWRKANRNPPLG